MLFTAAAVMKMGTAVGFLVGLLLGAIAGLSTLPWKRMLRGSCPF